MKGLDFLSCVQFLPLVYQRPHIVSWVCGEWLICGVWYFVRAFNFFRFILLLLLFFSLSKVFYPFHISQNFPFSSTPVSPLSTYIWLINICLSGFSFQGGRTLPFLLKIFLSLFSSFSLVHLLILFGYLLTLHGHGH